MSKPSHCKVLARYPADLGLLDHSTSRQHLPLDLYADGARRRKYLMPPFIPLQCNLPTLEPSGSRRKTKKSVLPGWLRTCKVFAGRQCMSPHSIAQQTARRFQSLLGTTIPSSASHKSCSLRGCQYHHRSRHCRRHDRREDILVGRNRSCSGHNLTSLLKVSMMPDAFHFLEGGGRRPGESEEWTVVGQCWDKQAGPLRQG